MWEQFLWKQGWLIVTFLLLDVVIVDNFGDSIDNSNVFWHIVFIFESQNKGGVNYGLIYKCV